MSYQGFVVRSLALAAALLACAPFPAAYPREPLRLERLVDSSDVVAVVNVARLQDRGLVVVDLDGKPAKVTAYTADLQTIRQIKGSSPDRFEIGFYTPVAWMGYPGLKVGPQMAFLRKSQGGFVFTDRHYPTLPALPVESETVQTGADPVDRVVDELGKVIASPSEPAMEKWMVFSIAYALPNAKSFILALRDAHASATDVELQQRIEAELIRRNELSTLPAVADWLLANTLSEDAKDEFLRAIAKSVTDPRAVPVLERLLNSSDPKIRRAAMESLWHMSDGSSARILINGLRDPDKEVRYYAVRALADISHQPMWGPSLDLFEQDEGRYLSYWREWAGSTLHTER